MSPSGASSVGRSIACLEAIRSRRTAATSHHLHVLLSDMRFAGSIRERGFTAAAVLTLALGVGASSRSLRSWKPCLLRPLPYAEAGRSPSSIIAISAPASPRSSSRSATTSISSQRQSAFAAIGAYGGRSATVYNLGEPFRASALLGDERRARRARAFSRRRGGTLQPAMPRPGAAKVAILGHALLGAPLRLRSRHRRPRRAVGIGRLSDRRRRAEGISLPARRPDRTHPAA